MVTGPIDLYTGGKGGKDPDEEADPISDRMLSNPNKESRP